MGLNGFVKSSVLTGKSYHFQQLLFSLGCNYFLIDSGNVVQSISHNHKQKYPFRGPNFIPTNQTYKGIVQWSEKHGVKYVKFYNNEDIGINYLIIDTLLIPG